MNDFSETHRRLAALAEVASGEPVTQRRMAATLGVSLGLANGVLRGLEEEGLLRVKRAPGANAAQYTLTRAGRTRMRALSAAFAAEAGALLRRSVGEEAAARLLSRRCRKEAPRGR